MNSPSQHQRSMSTPSQQQECARSIPREVFEQAVLLATYARERSVRVLGLLDIADVTDEDYALHAALYLADYHGYSDVAARSLFVAAVSRHVEERLR